MDAVQIIFLWEERIKGHTPWGEIQWVEWRTDSEAGTEMEGRGGGDVGADTQGAHVNEKNIDERWEECRAFDKWVCETGRRHPLHT